jgi:DNA-binding IclR family transcriptional regulator
MSWNVTSLLDRQRTPAPHAPPDAAAAVDPSDAAPVDTPPAEAGQGAATGDTPGRYVIAAVDRALDLLEALQGHAPCGLADLAAVAQCTRTAAFRQLRTLQARGYATQDRERGIWRLGSRWPALGHAAESQNSLAVTAAKLLAEASVKAGEHIYFLVRTGSECEVAAVHETSQPIRRYANPGTRLPLHAGPCRLLLADAPAAVRAEVLAGRLTRPARGTQTDPVWIAKDIKRLQERGWVATTDELNDGATTIAVAVRDANRQTCAALCIMTPSFRLRPARQAAVLEVLRDTAARVTKELGG